MRRWYVPLPIALLLLLAVPAWATAAGPPDRPPGQERQKGSPPGHTPGARATDVADRKATQTAAAPTRTAVPAATATVVPAATPPTATAVPPSPSPSPIGVTSPTPTTAPDAPTATATAPPPTSTSAPATATAAPSATVPPSATATAVPAAAWRDRLLQLVTAARADAGLQPLVLSDALTRAAQAYAETMAATGCFAHDCPPEPSLARRAEGAGYTGWRALGENIAAGYGSADAVFAGWMESPGHRANLLSAAYTELGLGLASSARGEPYWVQDFGARAAAR